MSLNQLILLSIGMIGLSFGFYCIYVVVMRKPGIKAINKGSMGFPFNLGSALLNRINFIWFGIVLVVFFGGLIFAVLQESFLK